VTPGLEPNPGDYVAAGYYLSRPTGIFDWTGTRIRRITLARDHTERRYFPGSWTLSWCSDTREERIEEAAAFGIDPRDLDGVISWADENFESAFGAWNAFFTIEAARAAARTFLRSVADVELWGAGLHRSLVSAFCAESAPPPPRPGSAPLGASGVHLAVCRHSAPLVDGGTVLGHEIMLTEDGSFQSVESVHGSEGELLDDAGVLPNADGLIDSLDDALACSRLLSPWEGHTAWVPWLIVRYDL
jgi:hypothetical protein